MSFLGLFRCQHKKLSRPFANANGELYVVCLECGKQWEYNWATMRQGREIPKVEEVKR